MKKYFLVAAIILFSQINFAQIVTVSTSPLAASNISQGATANLVYIAKMDVTALPVTINAMQFTLTGTHDANDLPTVRFYHNPTAASLTGATLLNLVPGTFAAPHAYNVPIAFAAPVTIAAGGTGYFIVAVDVDAAGTNGNTVKIDGAVNPVTFTYTTSPIITNNQTDAAGAQTILAAAVTLTTPPLAASNISQGSTNNLVYIAKMDVTALPLTVNAIQFTLTGTHDANDLPLVSFYHNPTAPSLTGATLLNNVAATFAAPHVYNVPIAFAAPVTIVAGGSGYFIVAVNVDAAGTNGNTVRIDGAANPVTFTYTASPTITNNQTDAAGVKTILAAGVTLTTSPLAASNISQGSTANLVYIAKMDVTALPVTINAMQFTLTGTHDANDLPTVRFYHNPTAASLTGATLLNTVPGTFAAPHAYNVPIAFAAPVTIAAGGTGYFIVAADVDAAGTNGNTVKIDGAANPVTFTYTTSPTITNNQTDAAGIKTILAAAVILTTSPLAASNISQGSTANVVYIAKMDVTNLPVTINAMQFTLTGTHDANDLPTIRFYHNPTAASLTGATLLNTVPGTFAAPHAYNVPIAFAAPVTIAAGGSGYFIVAADVDAAGTNGNTVKIDGAVNPLTFTYTTSPTITNNQTDAAGVKTILAAGVTLTTSPLAGSNISQGSTANLVYIAKMDVTALPVTINVMQFTLTGTHDANDLTTVRFYHNPTTASLTGATLLNTVPGTFAAPHTYNMPVNFTAPIVIAAGGSGYFIVAVDVDAAGTSGNTVKLNGTANPVSFTFTTSPPVTNNQTDAAGTQTILAAGVTLTTSPFAASSITQGSTNNLVYIAKMDVTSLPVTVNAIQFTLTGSHDANDLPLVSFYHNPTAPSLTGATLLNNVPATFAAPHVYNVPIAFAAPVTILAGGTGYFIVAVNVDAAATTGNTVKLNGAANPVTFSYTTSPPVTNNQTDLSGLQTIGSALPLTLINFSSTNTASGIMLQWQTAQEINTKHFEIEWSSDGLQFIKIATQQAAGNSALLLAYNFLHTNAVDGNNYYRLKMVDIDGRFIYSPIIKLNVNTNAPHVNVYSNPVKDVVQFNITSLKNERLRFNMFNAAGKLVSSRNYNVIKGSNVFLWDVKNLAAGSYFIVAENAAYKTLSISKL